MKYKIIIFFMILLASKMQAQVFINKGEIEFEVTTNMFKKMTTNIWDEMIKENISKFKKAYFTYTFNNNKSIYQFNRWSDQTKLPGWFKDGDEESSWYYDFTNGTFTNNKHVQGTDLLIKDSISKINWRITNDTREIAGFNCRKAIGIIMDSVYVFAFYTDEITIPGGPVSVNGLPGMILGLTIPRLYTSYIATKVNVNNIDISKIKPATAKKFYSYSGIQTLIEEKAKDWFNWGDDKAENQKRKNLFLWNMFL